MPKVTLTGVQKCNSCGFTWDHVVPGTVKEFDENAGRTNACLSEGTSNILYRATYPEVREAASERFAKLSTIVPGLDDVERRFETKELKSKKSDGTPETTEVWSESDTVHIGRVVAYVAKAKSITEDAARALLQPTWDEVAKSVEFDASVRERAVDKPKKAQKVLLDIATRVIAAGQGALLASQLATYIGHPVDGTRAEALALALAEDQKRIEAQIRAQQMSDLGITM